MAKYLYLFKLLFLYLQSIYGQTEHIIRGLRASRSKLSREGIQWQKRRCAAMINPHRWFFLYRVIDTSLTLFFSFIEPVTQGWNKFCLNCMCAPKPDLVCCVFQHLVAVKKIKLNHSVSTSCLISANRDSASYLPPYMQVFLLLHNCVSSTAKYLNFDMLQ